jgi:hypothetical protein
MELIIDEEEYGRTEIQANALGDRSNPKPW